MESDVWLSREIPIVTWPIFHQITRKQIPGCCLRIIIQSPDTDMLVLSVAHFATIASKELWFRIGVKDRLRFLLVHDVFQKLGDRVLAALPAFPGTTGYESNSSISGIGKTTAGKAMTRSQGHQQSLSL